MPRSRYILLAFTSLLALCSVWAQVAIPPIARVTDQTGTLTAGQQQELTQRLAAFEQAKGSQIAVLIVPTTQPETIEQYALRVAETWKLGREDVDDGALLLVARDDRALRIEVGYGLEGALPDAIARRIIEETITPRFRDGDYNGGIVAGVEQMIGVIQGEPLPEPAQRQEPKSFESYAALLFVPILIGQGLRRLLGALPAGALMGGLAGLVVGVISGFALLGLLVGVLVFVLVLGGFAGHVGSARGGRGGGFGGGGFSGGGGGFGGGGASGRW